MKYTAILLFYFFGWFISVPFDNFQATQQKSYGGRAKSGSTIHYQFKMLAKVSSDKLEFTNLWIGMDNMEIRYYSKDNDKQQQSSFERGDTIYVDAYVNSRPDENGNLVTVGTGSIAPPIEYQGKGLLEYKYKGVLKYYTIENIKSLPKVYYP